MKKVKIGWAVALLTCLAMVACKDVNPAEEPTQTTPNEEVEVPTVDSAQVTVISDQDNLVLVVYGDTTATVSVSQNILPNLTVLKGGAHVSIVQDSTVASEITYRLSGSSANGGFYTEGAYKATVELDNLSLTNVSAVFSGAAVHVQNGKRIKVKPLTGTTNTLVDAANGSQKGCLYVKGHIEFAQNGTLNVTGKVKHGIKAGEYISIKNSTLNILSAVGDGINCEQFFLMESGSIAINNVGDDGLQCDIEDAKTGSTGITADHEDEDTGNIYISGGQITVTTSASGVWDSEDMKVKSSSCLNAEGDIFINGGTLDLTSTGAAGKGISGDGNLSVSDAAVITIVTKGQASVASSSGVVSVVSDSQTLDRYTSDYKSSPKGIKIDGDIVIDGGTISVTTSGAGGEGIESKSTLTINGGYITVNAFDDGINSSSDMTINGGYVFAKGSKNDAIDANGNIYVKGGLIYAIGATNPEVAIDANTEGGYKLYVTGGTIIAVGNLEGGAQISGGTCKYTTSWSENTWHALYNGDVLVAAFKTPTKTTSGGGPGGGGSQKLVLYTSSTPALKSGVTVTDGTEIFGGMANVEGTVSGGTSVSLTNYSSGGGMGW